MTGEALAVQAEHPPHALSRHTILGHGQVRGDDEGHVAQAAQEHQVLTRDAQAVFVVGIGQEHPRGAVLG